MSVFALRPAETVVGLTVQTKESTFNEKKDLISFIAPSLNVNKD